MVGEIIGDVVVVVPGIMGSTLARRQDDRLIPVWAPSAGALVNAIRTLGGNIRSLTLPEDVGEGDPKDGIQPTGLMPDIHVVPGLWSVNLGYSRLVGWLIKTFHLFPYDPDADLADEDRPIPNLVCFAYDWRLSNRLNAERLKTMVEPVLASWRAQGGEFQDARFVFICHSMGGLMARWYAEQLGGAEVTRKIITIGTPHRGSIKALEGLVNGIRGRIGPFGIRLTDMARSFPSMYELLPAYQCVEHADGLRAPHEIALPELISDRVRRARLDFHDKLTASPTRATDGYDLHPIVGTRQPTWATAKIQDGRVVPSTLIDGEDLGGDGTVCRLAAVPSAVPLDSNIIVGLSEQHGALQHHPGVFEQLHTALTGSERVYMDDEAGAATIGLAVEQLHFVGEPIRLKATSSSDEVRLRATVADEAGSVVASELLWRDEPGHFFADLEPLPPGGYEIRVDRDGQTANHVKKVTASTLVWDPTAEIDDDSG
jgi:pimeloyl-ACP methyl ester carboxylesterase